MSKDQPAAALPPFEHHLVKAIYEILCDDVEPPNGEHWEGFAARRIVHLIETVPDSPAANPPQNPQGWTDDLVRDIERVVNPTNAHFDRSTLTSLLLRARDRIVEQDKENLRLTRLLNGNELKVQVDHLRAQLAEREGQCVIERTPLGTPVSAYTEAANPPNAEGPSAQWPDDMEGRLWVLRHRDLTIAEFHAMQIPLADLIERLAKQVAERDGTIINSNEMYVPGESQCASAASAQRRGRNNL